MKRIKPTIYIILGVHNELKYLKLILACFDLQTYKNNKLVIVDDGSTDGTYLFVKKNYPKAILIKSNGNLWWTGSLFVAIEEILKIANNDDFILTINNDCVMERDYLENIYNCSKRHEGAIIGSLIIDVKDKKTISDAGVKIHWENYRFEAVGPKDISQIKDFNKVEDNIDTLSTKGTLYPVKVFKQIGNFDKKHLPHYISDYEFACRAKRKGYKLLLSYKAKVYNEIDRTGFGMNLPQKPSIREILDLLFSRRSRINVVDHFWFIILCCPRKYWWTNMQIIFNKFKDLFSRFFSK